MLAERSIRAVRVVRHARLVAAALVVGSVMGGVSMAAASTSSTPVATQKIVTFGYTGTAQTWTVPANVHSVIFDLFGAQGGTDALGTQNGVGGLGGEATATLSVTPGQMLQVNVGGDPGGSGEPGFNGGGFGGGGAFGRPPTAVRSHQSTDRRWWWWWRRRRAPQW